MAADATDPFDPRAILTVLERRRVTYVVIGAVARVLHGTEEITDDLDICPRVAPDNAERLADALGELGVAGASDRAIFESLGEGTITALETSHGRLQLVPSPAGTRNGWGDLPTPGELRGYRRRPPRSGRLTRRPAAYGCGARSRRPHCRTASDAKPSGSHSRPRHGAVVDSALRRARPGYATLRVSVSRVAVALIAARSSHRRVPPASHSVSASRTSRRASSSVGAHVMTPGNSSIEARVQPFSSGSNIRVELHSHRVLRPQPSGWLRPMTSLRESSKTSVICSRTGASGSGTARATTSGAATTPGGPSRCRDIARYGRNCSGHLRAARRAGAAAIGRSEGRSRLVRIQRLSHYADRGRPRRWELRQVGDESRAGGELRSQLALSAGRRLPKPDAAIRALGIVASVSIPLRPKRPQFRSFSPG